RPQDAGPATLRRPPRRERPALPASSANTVRVLRTARTCGRQRSGRCAPAQTRYPGNQACRQARRVRCTRRAQRRCGCHCGCPDQTPDQSKSVGPSHRSLWATPGRVCCSTELVWGRNRCVVSYSLSELSEAGVASYCEPLVEFKKTQRPGPDAAPYSGSWVGSTLFNTSSCPTKG